MSAAIHRPFTWLAPEAQQTSSAKLACLTLTVANGIETCLDLVHGTILATECDDQPLLSTPDMASLLLLATASARMLSLEVEREIYRINQQARKEAAND